MYHVASRVTPQVIAKRVSVINLRALGAEPSIVADDVDCMPIFARFAPPLMGAIFFRRINTFATVFGAPTVLVCAGFGLQMTVAMARTIPGMRTRCLFCRIVRTATVFFFAIPITVVAGFGERMAFVATRTVPAVFAVGICCSRMMRLIVGTVPEVRTAVRYSQYLFTV